MINNVDASDPCSLPRLPSAAAMTLTVCRYTEEDRKDEACWLMVGSKITTGRGTGELIPVLLLFHPLEESRIGWHGTAVALWASTTTRRRGWWWCTAVGKIRCTF